MKNWQDRQGVWVRTDQGIGIRTVDNTSIEVPGEPARMVSTAYVDIVDGDGLTVAARVPQSSLSGVRIARLAEIPAARLVGQDPARLAKLGYV